MDGLARTLDPKYSLVACAEPFVKSLTISQGRGNLVGELAKQARDFIKFRLQQPSKSEVLIRRLEERLEEGELQIRVRSVESDRALRRINLAIKTLIYICWTGFTLIAGAILLIGNYQGWAVFVLVLSLFVYLQYLVVSLFMLSCGHYFQYCVISCICALVVIIELSACVQLLHSFHSCCIMLLSVLKPY